MSLPSDLRSFGGPAGLKKKKTLLFFKKKGGYPKRGSPGKVQNGNRHFGSRHSLGGTIKCLLKFQPVQRQAMQQPRIIRLQYIAGAPEDLIELLQSRDFAGFLFCNDWCRIANGLCTYLRRRTTSRFAEIHLDWENFMWRKAIELDDKIEAASINTMLKHHWFGSESDTD